MESIILINDLWWKTSKIKESLQCLRPLTLGKKNDEKFKYKWI